MTLSFHKLLAVLGSLVWLVSGVYCIHYMITTGSSEFHGWGQVPCVIFALGLVAGFLGGFTWSLVSGTFERWWSYNPTIKLGKSKDPIPKATIKKDS